MLRASLRGHRGSCSAASEGLGVWAEAAVPRGLSGHVRASAVAGLPLGPTVACGVWWLPSAASRDTASAEGSALVQWANWVVSQQLIQGREARRWLICLPQLPGIPVKEYLNDWLGQLACGRFCIGNCELADVVFSLGSDFY